MGKYHYLDIERMYYGIIGTAIYNFSSRDTYMIIYDTKNVVDYTMT